MLLLRRRQSCFYLHVVVVQSLFEVVAHCSRERPIKRGGVVVV